MRRFDGRYAEFEGSLGGVPVPGGPVQAEDTLTAVARNGLLARGHRLVKPPKPLGGGQAIWIDHDRGVLIGGSEPRKDGLALGYE